MGRVRSSIPRSRLPLHRRPFADPSALRRWLLVLVLAATSAALVGQVVSRAEATRRRWGDTRTVLVAARPLAEGDELAGAVRAVRWPVGLVPVGVTARLADDAVATGPIAAGAPITEAALASGPGGDDGRRRVALPVGPARLPLERGDRVDVWATVDPSISGEPLATRRVAVEAVVTSSGGSAVVVGVDPDEAAAVAEAVALATITLVGVG